MARQQATGGFAPNAYLHIAPDNTITITVHRSEMGQGVNTAIPMIVAEELEVDPAVIKYVQAPPDRIYGDQATGGSVSISGSYSTAAGSRGDRQSHVDRGSGPNLGRGCVHLPRRKWAA